MAKFIELTQVHVKESYEDVFKKLLGAQYG